MANVIKIMNTTLKTGLLLLVISCISSCLVMGFMSSCSENKNNITRADTTTQTIATTGNSADTSAYSKVAGKPSTGGILKILGTKLFNNPFWVNANYNLKTKTTQENSGADGRTKPSGSPTDSIGGAETPKPK